MAEDFGDRKMRARKLVVIESPYAGNVARNEEYARACMSDSIARGEAPFLSHLLYTQVLDDLDEEERKTGIQCGFAWSERADLVAVYTDLGISPGMYAGIERAAHAGQATEYRKVRGVPWSWE